MHRTGSEQSQSAGLADGGGQPPSAAPHHTALYDGVTDAEKFAYSVHVALLLGLLFPKGKQKDGRSRLRSYGISILYRMVTVGPVLWIGPICAGGVPGKPARYPIFRNIRDVLIFYIMQ